MNKQALINALFSSLGAFVCIGFLAYLNSSIEGAIWLIPPFGASMVLVMAVYDSPLAKPKNLILSHILFWGSSEQEILDEVKTFYSGTVIVAEDGMVFD